MYIEEVMKPLSPINTPLSHVYEALFESATEGLVVVNVEGQIVLANPRTLELFGYEEDELLGQEIEILIPSSAHHRHRGHRGQFFKHPARRTMGSGFTLSGERKDKSLFPVEISLNHFKVGEEAFVMALVTDISARKEAEEKLAALNMELEERVRIRTRELRESQRLYSLIAKNFPNGLINVFDRTYNYIFVEGKELANLGIESEMLIGMNYLDQLDPEIRAFIHGHLEPVFDGHNSIFEVAYKGNDYELNATGLPNATGEIDQILVVEHNISRQKVAEAQMYEALEKERVLNELKSRFVSMASHEFRTPLSTILSSAGLLTRYDQPEHADKRGRHINRIQKSVRNMVGILEDFLSLDKLEAGMIDCDPVSFDLQSLIDDLVSDMRLSLKVGQTIVVHFEGDTEVFLDPKLVRNVLVNLISNAIKYSPEQSVVEIWVDRGIGELNLKVVDQGIGIPEKEQSQLFGRFFRAGNVTNIEGTGLGLNIVQKYLALMKGEVSFESEEGKGSEFRVKLPVKLSYEKDTVD